MRLPREKQAIKAGEGTPRQPSRTLVGGGGGALSPRRKPGRHVAWSKENDGRAGWEADKGLKTMTGIHSAGKPGHVYPDTPLRSRLMIISPQPSVRALT